MKRFTSLLIVSLTLFAIASFAADTVESPAACVICGMDRSQFAHSRMLINYDDNTSTGTCSLRCMAMELTINSKPEKSIKVADFDTKKLIPADQAIWVVGGEKRGVMTMQPKWAFKEKTAAESFIKEFGGEIVSWQEALTAARAEFKSKVQE